MHINCRTATRDGRTGENKSWHCRLSAWAFSTNSISTYRSHYEDNRRKKKTRPENWDYCIRRYLVSSNRNSSRNSNSSNRHANNNRIIMDSQRLEPITRICRHRIMNTKWVSACILVAVNPVRCSHIHRLTLKMANFGDYFFFFKFSDVESHHHRVRSERIGTQFSPDRLDNDSPGRYSIRFF